MTIIDLYLREFEKGLKEEIEKEIKEEDYLNAKDFLDSLSRAAEGTSRAKDIPDKILALADAYHRVEKHSEDKSGEIGDLENELGEDLVAEIRATDDFWIA